MNTNKVKFIEFNGQKILSADSSNATEKELLDILADVDQLIAENISEAPFLFIGNYENIHYSIGLAEKFKSNVKANSKLIKKYAAVNVPPAAQFLAKLISGSVPYELHFFDKWEEGLEWLTK